MPYIKVKYMNNVILDIATTGSLVLGITAAISATGYLSKRFKPLFAVLLGVVISVLLIGPSKVNIISGLIASLSAMGLWSGTKNTVQTTDEPLG